MIKIEEKPLDVEKVLASVSSPKAGAVNLFLGTVRQFTGSNQVIQLEYEAYDAMAVKEIEKIVETSKSLWPVQQASVIHRKGILQVGEVAVAIAVSCPHRQASFEACQYIIDKIKETVPIWKKEIYPDGTSWVSAHP
ncbi:MAG: molybdenum cofactor biosynthesis protein MoaE [Candidatus Cyclobacteriaceae bacterium M3_2C_046]